MNIKFDRKILFPVVMAGTGILLSVGTFLLCQPFLKVIENDSKQTAAYVQETILVRDLLTSKNVKGIVNQLIAKEKIALVMDAVKRQAGQNNVPLTLLRPPFAARDEGDIFSRVLFDMQATASLKNLGEFLAAVRNMPEGLIDIESLRLLPKEGSSDLITATITFELLVARNYGQK